MSMLSSVIFAKFANFTSRHLFADVISVHNKIMKYARAIEQLSPPPPPPRDEFAFSCKQSVEFFKEISEKLARPG